MKDYLASGFKQVDNAGQMETFFSCLNLLDSLDFFKDYKQESFDLLRLEPGVAVLEVGCGLGDDAIAMIERIQPGGWLVAIDSSIAMIEESRRRHGEYSDVRFQVADVQKLDYPNESFDRCRIDRTLQHIANPKQAILEMRRVLRKQGVVVAFDNDWETFTVNSANRKITRAIANYWCDSFASGWIGRYMPQLFQESGLRVAQIIPRTLVIQELELANKVFDVFQTVEKATQAELVSEQDAEAWIEELQALDRVNKFFCSYTGFLIVAVND